MTNENEIVAKHNKNFDFSFKLQKQFIKGSIQIYGLQKGHVMSKR